MTIYQESHIAGHGNTVVQIVGDGNSVSISGAAALRLVRYDLAEFAAPKAEPSRSSEPGYTETGHLELDILSPFNRQSLPFQGRQSHLEVLTAWRDGPDWLSVHAVTGGGGRGKTRMALKLVDEAVAEGWTAGFARKDDLDVFVSQGCRTEWNEPTLVVVDYAASKRAELGKWLRTLAVEGQNDRPPLRILLLERLGGKNITWWTSLFEARDAEGRKVRGHLAKDAPIELAALSTPEERHAVFAAAFGAASRAPVPGPEDALDAALMNASLGGEPLFLGMFGLVAARLGLASAEALEADEIAMDLADQELRRIGKVWEAHDLKVLEAQPLHAHLAAAASLMEGLTAETAHVVIADESAALHQAIPAGQTGPALAALHAALPGDAGGIAPILPDILGEAAAILAFGALPDRGVAAVDRLAKARAGAVTASVIRSCQDFLIRGQRLPMTWLEALRAGTVEIEALSALANALPEDTLELREIAAEVQQSVLDLARELDEEARDPICAMALNNLSNRLSALGRREEALTASEEAVALRRSLADTRPDAFLPDLASALNNLSNFLSALGRREEALTAIEKAVALYRSLADARPDAFLPNLAMSLSVRSDCKWDLDNHAGCRQDCLETADILAPFVARQPQAHGGLFQQILKDYTAACSVLGDELEIDRIAPLLATAGVEER